ncbi:6-phosphogluconolactonase [Halalkalibacter wakoensis JCM 9140]|uniref:6-phosphogluconolactonase n=1 Tax=Halalkalibacter wakoensis JCM 9140 TaxID=1236970 RepID=W4Q9I0_9BACI|nr:lactonase family protein [Halalkalibacter wakoensis]GAE28328.1 6-phosphogluconolactonase [Halalkalibacter wakoensis JCM 9140]
MSQKVTAYVGTYTKGDSKGIYRFTLDLSSGAIEQATVAAELDNPTFLTISSDYKHLYSVSKKGEEGGVAAYSIESNGELSFLNDELAAGSPPCHVSLNEEDNYLFSANYHLGTGIAYQLDDNGKIATVASTVTHSGNGPHERQEKPHAHYAGLTPDQKYLCVVDLGTDEMVVYAIEDGNLNKHATQSFSPGTGPRHIQFHPNGKFAYVNGELSSEVIALRYESESGTFEQLQSLSSLPADFEGESIGGAIKVSADGKFVYASNRGHDSIAVFEINSDTGTLSFVEHVSTDGSFPRDFTIDPTGNFLLAANQDTSNIVQFSIDHTTGKLTKTGAEISVPNPVCVVFTK